MPGAHASVESCGIKLRKGLPPALSTINRGAEDEEQGQLSSGRAESFCMSTPRRGANDQSRHYIGTPRAESILSAFLDFDDGDADDAGPPLDFDDAMAALEAQCRVDNDDGECAGAMLGDECDCSGSTQCSSNLAGDDFVSGCLDDSEEDDEDDYEDDFESESDYSDEDEDAATAPPVRGGGNLSAAGHRTRSSSRVKRSRDPSRGAVSRSPQERSSSRVQRTRDPSRGALGRNRRCPSLPRALRHAVPSLSLDLGIVQP